MNPPTAVLVDSGVWAVWGSIVGLAAGRAKPDRFTADGPLTRLRPWENSGRTWEKVGVRHWKDSLPDLGTTFGGLSKRRALPGPEGRRLLEVETRRAELVHWVAALPVIAMPWWNPAWVSIVMAVYAVGANAPFIIIQRYNRGRLARLAHRQGTRTIGSVELARVAPSQKVAS